MTQEAPRPRTVAAAIALTSLGLVVALSPLATWAVRTYDFGLEQRVAGTRLGGWVLVALGVLVVAAGVLAMVGSRRSGTMALLAGSAAFIFAIVRAVQLDGQDFALSHAREVAWGLWVGVLASALTVPIALWISRRGRLQRG